jgi:hypothetical protein
VVESVHCGLRAGVCTEDIPEINGRVNKINGVGAQEESKGRQGRRDGERERKGIGSIEEGETREGQGRKERGMEKRE